MYFTEESKVTAWHEGALFAENDMIDVMYEKISGNGVCAFRSR